jgi:hypothetical protein
MDFIFIGFILVLGAASLLTVTGCARLKEKK